MLHLTTQNFESFRACHWQLSSDAPAGIRFFEVETTESGLLAAEYQTDLLPTFLFFKDQELIAVMQGMISQNDFDARLQKIFRNS